jgi:hypothetical protein
VDATAVPVEDARKASEEFTARCPVDLPLRADVTTDYDESNRARASLF